jgi:hypothetical protein
MRRREDTTGTSGSDFVVESALDNLESASTCREAVDLMVDAIVSACANAHAQVDADLGKVRGKGKGDDVPSVRREDIVRSVLFFSFTFPSSSSFR